MMEDFLSYQHFLLLLLIVQRIVISLVTSLYDFLPKGSTSLGSSMDGFKP
jgi:hypothetical protein